MSSPTPVPDAPLRHRHADPDEQPAPRHPWLRRVLATFATLLILLVIALVVTGAILRHDLRANLLTNENLLDGRIAVAGLTAPVTITRNAQNVPSIHASNLDDLLFAQGYITASDRLFQMDALRRHGAGTLAEILGPSLIQHDREQRTLQLRAAADRAAATLPPGQLHQLQAYANGVNAFINSAQKHSPSGHTLPIEFHILHYTPALWQPRDSLLITLVMAQDLATGFPTKLNREALAANLPANLVPDLYPTGSWRDHPPIQDAPDLSTPSAPILQIPLDRTQSSVTTSPELRHLDPRPQAAAERALYSAAANEPKPLTQAPTPPNPELSPSAQDDLLRLSADLTNHRCDGCRAGSNNWAVAGNHTTTGAPLLSNDMHLGLTAPDIWYEAALHIDTPNGLSVEGFTLPGVPFVIVGRNPYVAWGFTNSGADVQDVLIEHLRTTNNVTEYEHPGVSSGGSSPVGADTWSPVQHHPELIRVRGGHDIHLDVLTTGTTLGNITIQTPIITPLIPSEHRALALAWTIYDPSTLSASFLTIDSATDAASLVAAFASFTTVSQNLIYADAHHIGYHLLGCIPIRGPATQHLSNAEPLILSNNPNNQADADDESGNPQPSSTTPEILSSRPDRSNTLSSRPERSNTLSSRPERSNTLSSRPERSAVERPAVPTLPASAAYTIGSPISPIPVDALDATQTWSGYIPYNQLPAVEDPASGILATANARITPPNYPYAITLDWADPYRVERIHHLLEADIASNHPLTSAGMLRIQTDIHSEFDLLVAQRLAYALDHSALTRKNPQLQQAANILRNWNGDLTLNSAAADITSAAERELWPMLLIPQFAAHARSLHNNPRPSAQALDRILDRYTWGERRSALEQLLQNTPARWLPPTFANWNDLLATAVQRSLHDINAPHNLNTLTYGPTHPIEIAHPIFGSHSPISTLLGVALGTGPQPNSGDPTTIKAAALHFGPSERFTADLSNPDHTQANITTGESGNPASPWFLDQFQPWLQGTTFTLPLNHPTTTHTLTLTPK